MFRDGAVDGTTYFKKANFRDTTEQLLKILLGTSTPHVHGRLWCSNDNQWRIEGNTSPFGFDLHGITIQESKWLGKGAHVASVIINDDWLGAIESTPPFGGGIFVESVDGMGVVWVVDHVVGKF